jgi:hypothetical protein
MVLVISFALIPVAGVADQALVGTLSLSIAVGILVGSLVNGISHAFFPDVTGPRDRPRPRRPSTRRRQRGSPCAPR